MGEGNLSIQTNSPKPITVSLPVKKELVVLIQWMAIALGVRANLFLLELLNLPYLLQGWPLLAGIQRNNMGDVNMAALIISFFLLPNICSRVKKSNRGSWLLFISTSFREGMLWASMLIPDTLKVIEVFRRLIDKIGN